MKTSLIAFGSGLVFFSVGCLSLIRMDGTLTAAFLASGAVGVMLVVAGLLRKPHRCADGVPE